MRKASPDSVQSRTAVALCRARSPRTVGQIAKALGTNPQRVSCALHVLVKLGVAVKEGERGHYVYSAAAGHTGPAPPRRPKRCAKPVAAPFVINARRAAKRIELDEDLATGDEPRSPMKNTYRRVAAPVRSLCQECERFGTTRGCRECKWTTE